MAERAKYADVATRAGLAVGVAFAGFVGGVRPAFAQTVEMSKGQCEIVPAGSLVVGDATLKDGTKLYPYPQSGEFGNMTWINQSVEVCATENPFKFRKEATNEYRDQKRLEMVESGCQDRNGCNGVYEWHFPGNLPAGEEVRHTGTGAIAGGEVCPETVLDKILAPNSNRLFLHQASKLDADTEVFVNGKLVYTPDSNKKTGQQTRVYNTSVGVEVKPVYGGDYECDGEPQTINDFTRRADTAIEISKKKQGFDTVNLVEVMPDGSVKISLR